MESRRTTDRALLVLRLALGLSLAFVFGLPRLIHAINHIFLGEDWRFVRTVATLGFPIPVAFAIVSAIVESVCALLVAAGFWVRWNAVLIAFNMAVAVYSHLRFGQTMVPALLYLAGAVTLLVLGGGAHSMVRFAARPVAATNGGGPAFSRPD